MTGSLSLLLTGGLIGFCLFTVGYIVGVSSVIEKEARDDK